MRLYLHLSAIEKYEVIFIFLEEEIIFKAHVVIICSFMIQLYLHNKNKN